MRISDWISDVCSSDLGSAIGGAINLLDDKVPTSIPDGGIAGTVEGRLGTADDERSLVGGITIGGQGLALRVEGVHRSSNDYRVPKGFEIGRASGRERVCQYG